MAATNIVSDVYTNKTKVLELTVKDKVPAVVDLSSIVSPSDKIHWSMQRSKTDLRNHVHKTLGAGITFKNPPGSDGILLIQIDPADTADLRDEASEGDLSFFHSLSVEVAGQPAITAEGTLTIKPDLGRIFIELEAPAAADSGSSVTPGTFRSDNLLAAPAAANSGSLSEPGVLTTTVGVP